MLIPSESEKNTPGDSFAKYFANGWKLFTQIMEAYTLA